MPRLLSRQLPSWVVVLALVGTVGTVLLVALNARSRDVAVAASPPPREPIRVPLWIDPATVRHEPRFRFSFDPPSALRALREEERLDSVVAGAAGELDRFRKLTRWARAQFEPGVPSPYPPIDARIILRDIRSRSTGGFCAQYNYVLAQSLLSFGDFARYVTVVDHEVIEAWSRDERRWICLDPLHAATYEDGSGRALSVAEIHEATRRGRPVVPGPGSLPTAEQALRRCFGEFAVWIKNDHVSRPVNFSDLPRYKVRFRSGPTSADAGDMLSTPYLDDLYVDPTAP